MPGHSLSTIMLFVSVAAIALASQHTDINTGRAPAMTKKELLGNTIKLRHTEKLHGPLASNIELIGAVPEKAGDVFVLKGVVSSSENLRDVDYKWNIPAGLELVNGAQHGTISIVNAGEAIDVQLTLRSVNGENHQVHLLAAAKIGKTRFSDNAQYNTLLQPMVEAGKKALAKSTEDAAAKAKKQKSLKIFH